MVSPRKSSSALSILTEERRKVLPSSPLPPCRASTKSCESLYSASSRGSATILYSRKAQPVPAANREARQAGIIPGSTDVRQRVLSARRLRMKTYQNQLADAQQTIAELANENRMLRTLHKRQDTALAKYESTNAELPKLLHSHAEELRVWQTKYRNLQAVTKDLEQKIKQKESQILSLSDQNKYFHQLNKDKNLEERQRLTEKVQSLEARLQEKENDMKLLARKVQLESKNLKQQLLNEQKKTKEVMMKLEKARLEISGYRKLDELNLPEKFSNISLRRKPMEDIPKIDKDLDKGIEKIENEFLGPDEIDFPVSNRSSRCSISKLDSQRSTSINNSRRTYQVTAEEGETAQDTKRSSRNEIMTQKRVLLLETRKSSTASQKYKDDFENIDDFSESLTETIENEDYIEDIEDDGIVSQDDHERRLETDDTEIDDEIILSAAKTSSRMKEEISTIRRQISDDYKEREAFLDTFCRQATTTSVRPESAKKRNSINLGPNIPNNRKHKLLAALKAIDTNTSQD